MIELSHLFKMIKWIFRFVYNLFFFRNQIKKRVIINNFENIYR